MRFEQGDDQVKELIVIGESREDRYGQSGSSPTRRSFRRPRVQLPDASASASARCAFLIKGLRDRSSSTSGRSRKRDVSTTTTA
ncbi:MAG: hypothetical protein MZU97_11875 [Bacillus subtilis]|nr:hypothetical protein [Bacillus subtilis]